jgi:hypothetical protein
MKILLIPRWIPAIAAALLMTTSESQASAWHSFTIRNYTPYQVQITEVITRCVYQYTFPRTMAPFDPNGADAEITVNWQDDNNPWSVPNFCNGKDKFIAFSFQMVGAPEQFNGYLGMTHRNLYSDDWYNGQFYAQTISVDKYQDIQGGSDGPPPPAWIEADCQNGDTDCIGPWSEIEMAGRDGYNWPRVHETDDGWAFDIFYNSPVWNGGSSFRKKP